MTDFAKLKKMSTQDSINTLKEKAAALSGNNKKFDKEDNQDKRFWQPTVDAAGNGFAVIRFLPTSKHDDLPYVRTWDHGFQGPTGKWYIENSLTTIEKKDPVTDFNNKLWATKDKANEELAKKYKRRLHYIANIYVVNDPNNAENNGKVFLYKFGKKVMDKINDCITPAFDENGRALGTPDYDPTSIQFDPFSLWDGANFRLKVRKVDGQRNFDQSTFDSRSPLFKSDDKLEAVWNQEYALKEFVDPDSKDHRGYPRFKSYEELKKRFDIVLGLIEEEGKTEGSTVVDETPAPSTKKASAPKIKETPAPSTDDDDGDGDDDGDNLAFFRKLAKE